MVTLMLTYATVTQIFHLPPGLLSAVCFVESRHRVEAISYFDGNSHSHGACQIKLATARSLGFRGNARELRLPENNVYYAGKLLRFHLRRCRSIPKAIMAYNTGSCRKGVMGYLGKVTAARMEGK